MVRLLLCFELTPSAFGLVSCSYIPVAVVVAVMYLSIRHGRVYP